MSRKKEFFSQDFSKVKEWVASNQTLPEKRGGGAIKSELAKLLGVSKSSINYFEEHGVPLVTVMRFARQYRASLDQLLFGESLTEPRKNGVVIRNAIETQDHKPFVVEVQLGESRSRQEDLPKGDSLRAWRVDTTDMEPTLRRGEIIIIDTLQTQLIHPGFYALRVTTTDLVIKHFIPRINGTVEEIIPTSQRSIVLNPEELKNLPLFGRVVKVIRDV